jgi:hypothetical protein
MYYSFYLNKIIKTAVNTQNTKFTLKYSRETSGK